MNPKEIKPLPPNVEEILKKHYIDVPATTIKKDDDKKLEQEFNKFSKASETFYKNTEYIITYKNGYTIGQYGSQEQRFEVFMKRIKEGLKEMITDELRSEGHTTEDLATTYKLFDNAFELLIENISKQKITLDMKKLLTKMHGFINGYVDQAKIKEE